jgi:hypothetical protein
VKILLYLLVPVLVVAAFATVSWVRNRQPTSLESGVDAFQREMKALSPDAAPLHRRRDPADARPPSDRPVRRPPSDRRT